MKRTSSSSRFSVVSEVIGKEMDKPYQYGVSDCFFFPLAVADALGEGHLQAEYAGIYSTASGAARALRKRGLKSMAELFARHFEGIAPAMAAMGDIAVVGIDGIEHGAICVGGAFLVRGEGGLSTFSLSDVKAAFRVV